MTRQRSLFEPPPSEPRGEATPPLDRFQGAMLFSAVGDALGWPTEFIRSDSRRKPPFALPIRDFVKWEKFVGGRWWGYKDDIAPGEYSDDTQLTLAVARSLSSKGAFEPERFAYSEFPLWLHYERGGGRSIKTAARAMIQRKTDWLHNFYKQGGVEYRSAGANGAAMRNLPIALASCRNEERLVRDSFLNAIVSHGHPRAILGTILFGLAARYAVIEEDSRPTDMVDYLRESLRRVRDHAAHDELIAEWVNTWEKQGPDGRREFAPAFEQGCHEAERFVSAMMECLEEPVERYYRLVGALEPSTRGSGVATVCAAIFLFLRNRTNPAESVFEAANAIGSDTDTIAGFVGALVGARHGTAIVPPHLAAQLQDREYILKTAGRLHALVSGDTRDHAATDAPLRQQEAYLRILAWEMGLHEMFWDAIEIGGAVIHPTLGRGVIKSKEVRDIAREGYAAKLIRIVFDCGQSCVFHSRVQDNEKVFESLARDIERALQQ